MTPAVREANVALINRFVETFNDRDREGFAATLAPDFVCFAAGNQHDTDTFLDAEWAYHDAFPDLEYTLDEYHAGDSVVGFRWTLSGTHEGDGGPGLLASVEPTGNTVSVTGLNSARIEDGRFVELWGEWDALRFYNQLGLVEVVEE